MRLSAPKFGIFLISLIAGAAAIVSRFVAIPYIGAFVVSNAFWILAGAFVLLLLSVIFKGL